MRALQAGRGGDPVPIVGTVRVTGADLRQAFSTASAAATVSIRSAAWADRVCGEMLGLTGVMLANNEITPRRTTLRGTSKRPAVQLNWLLRPGHQVAGPSYADP